MKNIKFEIRKMKKALNNNTITVQEWWCFIAEIKEAGNGAILEEVIKFPIEAQHRLRNYKSSPLFLNKVRPFISRMGYSDIHPFEVVRVVSAKCVEVRALETELTSKMEFIPGGFAGICINNCNQDYNYTSNPAAPVTKIFLGKKGWGNGNYRMLDQPLKHYDYNF